MYPKKHFKFLIQIVCLNMQCIERVNLTLPKPELNPTKRDVAEGLFISGLGKKPAENVEFVEPLDRIEPLSHDDFCRWPGRLFIVRK